MRAALTQCKSKYAILYRNAYPKKENILEMWDKYFGNDYEDNVISELEDIEAKAIVNWVYQAFNNNRERERMQQKKFFQKLKISMK
jgi:ribosomal protein S17E